MRAINKVRDKKREYIKQNNKSPEYLIVDFNTYQQLTWEISNIMHEHIGEVFEGMIVAVTQYHTEYELIEVF